MPNPEDERRGDDRDDPANREMFQGIRFGRPSDRKFDLRAFLIILAIAAAVTLILNALFPREAPPKAPKRAPAPERSVRIRLAPPPAPAAPAPAPATPAPPAAADGGR